MNEIILFPKSIELAIGARLDDYITQGISLFEELKKAKLFSTETEWEYDRWFYQANGGESILFCNSDIKREENELTSALKTFVIFYLYENRLKGSLPTLQGKLYGFRKLIQTTAIRSLSELNQDIYTLFLNEISDSALRSQGGLISGCNQVIRWLQQRNLLSTPIDLARPPSLSSLPALTDKMPSRDLVQAILEAKWKVAEVENDSVSWANDMLAVFAQSFQYGMGLRIGEVLRLPADPIKHFSGKMFFTVWTEKGKQPINRYIPTEWQEVFEYTVSEIRRITEPYRQRARELENRGRLSEVEERLNSFQEEKNEAIKNTKEKLYAFLKEKGDKAQKDWSSNMRGDIAPNKYYLPTEIRPLLPIQVTSDEYNSHLIRKTLKSCGIEFTPIPGKFTKNRIQMWHVKGSNVIDCIKSHITFRSEHVTHEELFHLIQGRTTHWRKNQNVNFKKHTLKTAWTGGSFRTFTMRGNENYQKRGHSQNVIHLKGANKIIEHYCGGGYNFTQWIDSTSFNRLFSDLFQSSVGSIIKRNSKKRNELKCLVIQESSISYYCRTTKPNSPPYVPNSGYLIKQESIHDLIFDQFKAINLNIEQEIYAESLDPSLSKDNELTVVIDSASFHVKQTVSDHLMLTADIDNKGGKPLIPKILGYNTLVNCFKGGGRNEKPGLFQRYGVSDDVELTKEFQTHKGRHWKTTSLFRSGASHEVVNLWMGRDPSQGSHYDHNTDHERAKKVKEAMKNDSSKYVGHIASKLRQLQEQEVDNELVDDFLDSELKVVQHNPNGMCSRELAISPCDITMRCLQGKDGKGCKHFLFDLSDTGQVERLSAWTDSEQRELTRLETMKDLGYAQAQMHIDAKAPSLKNARLVLDAHKNRSLSSDNEIRPFRIDGSDPSNCPFECGE